MGVIQIQKPNWLTKQVHPRGIELIIAEVNGNKSGHSSHLLGNLGCALSIEFAATNVEMC